MKIVVNICCGGFGLSREAKLKLYKLGCPHTRVETPDEFFGLMLDEGKRKEHLKRYKTPMLEDGRLVVDTHRGDYKSRTCKNLIKVVEEMGKEACGRYSKLKIIEIPDDIDWEVTEYDGWETIEERPRRWG